MGAWPHLVAGLVSYAILRCFFTATQTRATVEGDSLRFGGAIGIRRLGWFPLAAVLLISAFLFGFGERDPIPWLLLPGAAGSSFVSLAVLRSS
jgi:hypothetical protein